MKRKKVKQAEIDFEPGVVPHWVHKPVHYVDLNIHYKINYKANIQINSKCSPLPNNIWYWLYNELTGYELRQYSPLNLQKFYDQHRFENRRSIENYYENIKERTYKLKL